MIKHSVPVTGHFGKNKNFFLSYSYKPPVFFASNFLIFIVFQTFFMEPFMLDTITGITRIHHSLKFEENLIFLRFPA